MNKLILVLGAIIIVLIILLGFTYEQMRTNKNQALRWENNYQHSQEEISRVQMTFKEFKEQKTKKEDSLLKAIDIKPKQVEKIVYIENSYINADTHKVELVLEGSAIIDLDYIPGSENNISEIDKNIKRSSTFLYSIECLSVQGTLRTVDKNAELYITQVNYKNYHSYVAYWKRREWKILGIKTRIFGKKQGELEISSDCGKTKVKEIDIIKKK